MCAYLIIDQDRPHLAVRHHRSAFPTFARFSTQPNGKGTTSAAGVFTASHTASKRCERTHPSRPRFSPHSHATRYKADVPRLSINVRYRQICSGRVGSVPVGFSVSPISAYGLISTLREWIAHITPPVQPVEGTRLETYATFPTFHVPTLHPGPYCTPSEHMLVRNSLILVALHTTRFPSLVHLFVSNLSLT